MGETASCCYLTALVQYLDELPDDQFPRAATDASDYVSIRFSESQDFPPPIEKLVELLNRRLRDMPPELAPPLPLHLARFLAHYQHSRLDDASQLPRQIFSSWKNVSPSEQLMEDQEFSHSTFALIGVAEYNTATPAPTQTHPSQACHAHPLSQRRDASRHRRRFWG